jgi:transcriptional repressor NrdR
MSRLRKLDHIAYIRFASVYREFADITMLKEEVDNLANVPLINTTDQLPLIPPDEFLTPLKNRGKSGR